MTENTSISNVKKFVPKRRTPYLMQEEMIKQKESLNNQLNKQEFISSQLVVNDRSSLSLTDREEYFPKEVNFHDEVLLLSGLQKKIAHFFARRCIERNKNDTGIITSEMLCKAAGSTQKTIKKILERMLEKKLLCRLKGKPGKGGFSIFSLDENFIKIIRLQLELESDFIENNSGANRYTKETSRTFPQDWNNIDLTNLIEAFKGFKGENIQFFGKNQLKSIYNSIGDNLTSVDVQESINAFSHGLKNFSDKDPYMKMHNPAAVLFETLRNGSKWEDRRYLNVEEEKLYSEYNYLSEAIQKNIKKYYKEWKNTNREEKYDYYQKKMRSNEFFSDRVFEEKAWEDYNKNIWKKEKNKILIETIGIDENLLKKFELISTKKLN